MQRVFQSIVIIFFFSLKAAAQETKPIIDTVMLNSWPNLTGDAILSKDGRYTAFTISNQPIGSNTLVVCDVTKNWKREIVAPEIDHGFYFSRDSKKICWQNGDSLFLQYTGRDEAKLLGVVGLYKFPKINKGEWIAYHREGEQGIVLLNLITEKKMIFPDAKDIHFNDVGNTALIEITGTQNKLQWIDLNQQKSTTVWTGNQGSKPGSYQFDRGGKQLAFIVNEPSGTSVYYYKEGMEKAIKRLDDNSQILKGGLKIGLANGFSVNGKWLFIKINKPKPKEPKREPNIVPVDVWNYRDEIVNSAQAFYRRTNTTIDLAMAVAGNDEGVLLNPDGLIAKRPDEVTGDYSILSSDTIPKREYWWPHSPKPSEWLVSLKDGSRRLFLKEHGDNFTMYFSPTGRWITWWDKEYGVWMDYDLTTGQTHNISSTLPFTLASDAEYATSTFNQPVSPQIAGWYKGDSALLIYDNYDIWKVDPACHKAPINITGGHGRKSKTELRFIKETDDWLPLVCTGNETTLLSGFNRETKYNGFLRLKLNKPDDLQVLNMSPFTWFFWQPSTGFIGGMKPLQGGQKQNLGWLVMRQSAQQFPNYFYTRDFKLFTALTDLAPQRDYNWLTSELVSWTLPDGRKSQGILYKPENFDSTRKYPVIFNYYEKHSYETYQFRDPGLTDGNIDIPYFVSRGYLVFMPDIYYGNSSKTDVTSGQYALQAVESAADELVKRSYIDASRLAIQGHSFGGFETNYILTHSNRFAAAAEGAGFTDVISNYLSLVGARIGTVDIKGIQSHAETGHQMYGATIWERPDLYITNSPVLSADNAKAPLLIFHNKMDDQVPWRQGLEMYMALRRLGKPCWMLQYDNGTHGVEGTDAKDFTIRLTQYFDHYLKEAPAPIWMTQGIPAHLKQIETGYAYDPCGNCGKDCLVCKQWNEKFKKDSNACWREIEEKTKSEHWMSGK